MAPATVEAVKFRHAEQNGWPGTLLYVPAAHRTQALAPGLLDVPGGHSSDVAFVAPLGQAYPEAHKPEQPTLTLMEPSTVPNLPAGHSIHDVCRLVLP